jgi:hypothetical protein
MGLASDPKHGFKSTLKQHFSHCVLKMNHLGGLRVQNELERTEMSCGIDGNVAMMAIPQTCCTLDDYVSFLTNEFKTVMATCAFLVVVFDEPKRIPRAKAAEQQRRDDARKTASSNRPEKAIPDDVQQLLDAGDFSEQDLAYCSDLHHLVLERSTRSRVFDVVMHRVFYQLRETAARWEADGFGPSFLLFDGIPSTCDYARDERVPSQLTNEIFLATALMPRESVFGEGDLKLAALETTVLYTTEFADPTTRQIVESIRCHCTHTIDTDSLLIGFLTFARLGASLRKGACSYVVLPERASVKQDRHFLCVHTQDLYASIIDRVCVGADARILDWHDSADSRFAAACVFSALVVLGGCDFVAMKGMKASFAFEMFEKQHREEDDSDDEEDNACALSTACQHLGDTYGTSRVACTAYIEDMAAAVVLALQNCASAYNNKPRSLARIVDTLSNTRADDVEVLRAVWVVLYWLQFELCVEAVEFGCASRSEVERVHQVHIDENGAISSM